MNYYKRKDQLANGLRFNRSDQSYRFLTPSNDWSVMLLNYLFYFKYSLVILQNLCYKIIIGEIDHMVFNILKNYNIDQVE